MKSQFYQLGGESEILFDHNVTEESPTGYWRGLLEVKRLGTRNREVLRKWEACETS